ncbi:Chromosome partition protein Smc [Burkholderia sp. AD24]|nr:Chromosome partition protein Smc [Burkholderia sp. AD24]
MFPSVSSSLLHPWSAHVAPEPHQPESPRPSTPHLALPANYTSLPSGKLQPDVVHPGLKIDEKGRRYISDGGHMYAIRFDRDHQTERVYQPDNPVKPGIPVRLNGEGRYVRHNEVGLKGGSPGQELARRLQTAHQNLNRAQAAQSNAQGELMALNAEIRRSANPDAGLRQRQQAVQRTLDDARMTIAIEEGHFEAARREVQLTRNSMQAQLADKQRHRENGRELEQTTRREIDALQTAINASDHPSATMRNDLHRLQDDLRRIQNANHALDQLVLNLDRDLRDLPHC